MKACPLNLIPKNIARLLLLMGILAVIFYALHIVIGSIYYPGYSHLTQAISDLTGEGAPSQAIASIFSTIYGVLSVVFAFAVFLVFRNDTKLKKIASIIFFFTMLISLVGYGLFPLDNSLPTAAFVNIMHIIVTIFVVLGTIVMFVLFGISFIREKNMRLFGYFTFLCLFLMFLGSMLMGVGSSGYFGVYERLNIYAIQSWYFIFSIVLFVKEKPIQIQPDKNLE